MSIDSLNSKVEITSVQNGIQQTAVAKSVGDLSIALASTYSLYLKTQKFHWNNVGPDFYSLHKLSEGQYEELAEASDTLAERIRALGHIAPATFSQFMELSFIKEEGQTLTTQENIQIMIADHEKIAAFMRKSSQSAQDGHDEATVDLYAARIAHHEKSAWMLRATLG